jgi:anti-anti-sigma factor
MLKITKEERQYRVELFQVNRFNTLCSELVRQQLQELVEEPGTTVVFNLEGIQFIDTAGFQVLEDISNYSRNCGSQFKLCNVSDEVSELILLLDLGESFTVCACENVGEKILLVLD